MRPLRWGMIGGGEGAFIGAVHRMAARLDGRYQLVAGVFSSDAEKTKRSAVALGVDPARAYPSVDAMIAAESQASRRRRSGLGGHAEPHALPAVGGVPRSRHRRHLRQAAHHQSRRCREAGEARGVEAAFVRRHLQLHRLPDGPARQAAGRRRPHRQAARGTGRISAGLARHRAREDRAEAGELAHRSQAGRRGRARATSVRTPSSSRSSSPARRSWKSRPTCRRHRSRTASSTTTSTCCCVSPMARAAACGRARWPSVTSTAIGCACTATTARIQWFQERPEELLVVRARRSAAHRASRRSGHTHEFGRRCPGGHPEGFIEAFSQLYTDFAERVTARLEKRSPKAASLFAPDAVTGTRVMAFIEAVLKSGQANSAWTKYLRRTNYRFEGVGSMSTEATMTGVMPRISRGQENFRGVFRRAGCDILLLHPPRVFDRRVGGGVWSCPRPRRVNSRASASGPSRSASCLLSLIIDRIGFKMTLWFAAACHLLGLVLILQADGYWSLYWGTFVLSLGNGAVEAGINPLIAANSATTRPPG